MSWSERLAAARAAIADSLIEAADAAEETRRASASRENCYWIRRRVAARGWTQDIENEARAAVEAVLNGGTR